MAEALADHVHGLAREQGRVSVPQVMDRDFWQRDVPERLTAPGHVPLELTPHMLTVPVLPIDVTEDQRVIANEPGAPEGRAACARP